MPRSISLHGFCSVDLPRKLARHRSLSKSTKQQTLPYGHTDQSSPQHISRCQRKTRLADLCRFCSVSNTDCSRTLCRRSSWSRTRQHRLCTRCHDHRPLPVGLPLGSLSKNQRGYQTTYFTRSVGQYPFIYPYLRRQDARRQCSGYTHTRARFNVHHGPRLSGFRPLVPAKPKFSIFRDTGKIESSISQDLLASCRQEHRATLRPNNKTFRVLHSTKLSRQIATGQILRCRDPKTICVSDQQFQAASINNYRTLSFSLAGRAVFQMDKTTPTDQIILRHIRERCQDTSLDSGLSICSNSDHQKTTQNRDQSLLNFTDFEPYSFRNNDYKSTTYRM